MGRSASATARATTARRSQSILLTRSAPETPSTPAFCARGCEVRKWPSASKTATWPPGSASRSAATSKDCRTCTRCRSGAPTTSRQIGKRHCARRLPRKVLTRLWQERTLLRKAIPHSGTLLVVRMPNRSATAQMSVQAFDELFAELCTWGSWGAGDVRGALNYITPDHVRQAATHVRTGRTVGLGLCLDTETGPDNPSPVIHKMTELPTAKSADATAFSCDYIGIECHGDAHSHIDALCHVAFRGA